MRVIDSHTGGEPTRIIVEGGPDLGEGSLADRCERFRRECDKIRRRVILEPRGVDFLIGGLLEKPVDSDCAAGVVFFNNVGTLGMCGHGTIGLGATLAYLGLIEPGTHRLETPVGEVSFDLKGANEISFENVPSYRYRKEVMVRVPELGSVTGDVAWGGNWFFLSEDAPCAIKPRNIKTLTEASEAVKRAIVEQGITGENEGEIDHIEFYQPGTEGADIRNFVLCPGGAYDRSPCGTGTSAKLACLAADEKLQPGETWVQESVIGSRFEGSYRKGEPGQIIPRVSGTAFVTGDTTLLVQEGDPFANGIPGFPGFGGSE